MSEFFEVREQEYREALARQDAERRAETQKERAKVKKEADAIYTALVEAFPAPPEAPAEDTRSFRDAVADHIPMTPGERERQRSERYRARKAAVEQQDKRGQSDELDLDHLVNPPQLDWDEIDSDTSDEYPDED